MDDNLNTAEMELNIAEMEMRTMLSRVLSGPLGPLRADVAALRTIEPSVKKIVEGICGTVGDQADKILWRLGDIEDLTNGGSGSLAAAQADLAKALARLEGQAAGLSTEQAQIAPALAAVGARLDEHAARLQALLAALQTDTASRLRETVLRLEASQEQKLVALGDQLTASLAPRLAAIMRLGMACAAGIVLTLVAVLLRGFWH